MYYQTTQVFTEAVRILTDFELANPHIVCPITAVLTPAKPYLTLASDFTSISLNGSQASDTDVGIHFFTLTVNSLRFPGNVAQATYTF